MGAEKTQGSKTEGAESKALAPTGGYKVLAVNMTMFKQALEANAGAGGVNPHQLDRVKVPGSGGTTWEVPTLDGVQKLEEIEGIIVHWKEARAYFKEEFSGQGVPPDCASADGITGAGTPGGECLKCPLAQFGTARGKKAGEMGKGQACKQMRLLFILRPADLLPMVISVPPTSLDATKKYFMRLLSNMLPLYTVVSGLALKKERNANGVEYAELVYRRVRSLSEEESARLIEVRNALMPVFDKETVRHGDEAGS